MRRVVIVAITRRVVYMWMCVREIAQRRIRAGESRYAELCAYIWGGKPRQILRSLERGTRGSRIRQSAVAHERYTYIFRNDIYYNVYYSYAHSGHFDVQ